MPQALPFITAGAGLYGAIKGSNAQDRAASDARSANQQGLDLQRQISEPQIKAMNALMDLYHNYDPGQEAQAGVSRAGDVFSDALGKALSNVNTQFAGGGSGDNLSSEFGVRSQDVANRVSDPFRAYLADAYGNPSEKKANFLKGILGTAPSGGLADGYFKAAANNMNMVGMYQPNYGTSLGMLGGALNRLFPPSNASLGIQGPDSSNPFYRGIGPTGTGEDSGSMYSLF